MRLSFFEDENRLIGKTSKPMLRKNVEQKIEDGRSDEKLFKIVVTGFVKGNSYQQTYCKTIFVKDIYCIPI